MCCVCLRGFSLTSAGHVRVDGLVHSQCQGSGQLLRPVSQRPSAGCAQPRSSLSTTPCDNPHLQPSPLTPRVGLQSIQPVKILRRILRGARQQCLLKCCTILDEVVNINSVAAWEHLLHFPTHCLQVPLHSRGHSSLATQVKNQLNDEADPVPAQTKRERENCHRCTEEDALQCLSRRVASKLEEGDFRGAVRLACSDNRLAPSDSATFAALQAKHPSPHCDKVIPPSPLPQTLQVEAGAVIHAIQSFPSRSVGGPDCLHLQHLKDILQVAGDESSIFSQSLASFCALVLEGRMLDALRPFFFGASLVALEKSEGMRSIAVGCTLRRLLAKIAGQMVVDGLYMGSDGVRGEVEAAVHATRKYLMNLPRGILCSR